MILWAALMGVCLAATLAARCARWTWVGELCVHFPLQYAVLCGVLGIVAVDRGWWLGVGVAAVAALWNLSQVLPLVRQGRATGAGSSATLRVLFANVFYQNFQPAAFMRALAATSPDIVILAELPPEWMPALATLATAYPVSKFSVHRHGRSLGLISRVPIRDLRMISINPAEMPTVIGQVAVGEHRMTLIGTRVASPTTARRAWYRDAQLRQLAQLASSQSDPVLLVGDLNTTSWSPVFKEVLRIGGLRDSRRGFGLQTTWPAPLRWCGLSIDHGLVSPGVIVRRRVVGPWIGSDHFPIVLDVALGRTA